MSSILYKDGDEYKCEKVLDVTAMRDPLTVIVSCKSKSIKAVFPCGSSQTDFMNMSKEDDIVLNVTEVKVESYGEVTVSVPPAVGSKKSHVDEVQ